MNAPPPAPDPVRPNRRDPSFAGRLRRLGWKGVEFFITLAHLIRFLGLVLMRSGTAFRRPRLILQQIKIAGVDTSPIILIAGLFVGFVLGLQFYVLLNRYGQVEIVGAGVALTLFRELGPVGAGLLFVGCACTSMTAAIGLKRSSEQIAAMEMMAVDPIARELAPRLWAGTVALPVLTVYFDAIGVAGAYLIAVVQIGIDEGVFWSTMQNLVFFHRDFVQGTLKSVVFGFVAVGIALYEGFHAVPTAEGVAHATTRTVIKGSLAILGFNVVLTAFMVE